MSASQRFELDPRWSELLSIDVDQTDLDRFRSFLAERIRTTCTELTDHNRVLDRRCIVEYLQLLSTAGRILRDQDHLGALPLQENLPPMEDSIEMAPVKWDL